MRHAGVAPSRHGEAPALFPGQPGRGQARVQTGVGDFALCHAGLCVAVLRPVELNSPDRAHLVAVCYRRGGDAVAVVCTAAAGAKAADLFQADSRRDDSGNLCLPNLRRPARRRLVPRSGPAHSGRDLRADVSAELSAAGSPTHGHIHHYLLHRRCGTVSHVCDTPWIIFSWATGKQAGRW